MLRTRLVVIDFEALTPTGRTKVAAITLICRPDGTLEKLDQFTSLMRPPADVPITARDQETGITPTLLATAAHAEVVMTQLDRRVSDAVRLAPGCSSGMPPRRALVAAASSPNDEPGHASQATSAHPPLV